MRLLGKLMVIGGLAPGAVLMLWGFISTYRAIGQGGDVDGEGLRAAAEGALRVMKIGVPVAVVGMALWVVGTTRRRRPQWRSK